MAISSLSFLTTILIILNFSFKSYPIGQAALPTLLLQNNARYSALGEAGGAICFDEGAVNYNPAGLFFIPNNNDIIFGTEMDFEYLLPEFNLEDLYHRNICVYGKYKNWLSFALSDKYISFGENEWTDEVGRLLGTFNSFDNFIILSIAGNLTKGNTSSCYALGLNIKYIYSRLADVPVGNGKRRGIANSFAIDAGVLYRESFLNIFSAGLTLQNMGPDIVYIDQNYKDPIPFNVKLSLAATKEVPKLLKATIVLDLNKELIRRHDPKPADPFLKSLFVAWNDDSAWIEEAEIIRSYGFELLALDHLALRLGRMVDKAGQRWESTYGIGFNTKYVHFSISSIGELEHQNFIFNSSDESTARRRATKYSIGIQLPICVK